jgi:hypothetical protein
MAITLELQPSFGVIPSGNPMWFRVATDTALSAILRLNVAVYYRADTSDVYALLTTLSLPYDPFTSTVSFDVRKLIDASIDYPDLQTDFLYLNRVSVQFYLELYETVLPDDTPLAASVESNEFFAIKAVTDRIRASEQSFYRFSDRYKFRTLTEMPRTRKIFGDNAIVISWINLIDSTPETYYRFDFLAKYENDDQLTSSSSVTLPYAYSGNFYFLPSQIESFLGPPPAGVPLRSLSITVSAETAPDVFTQMDSFLYLWQSEPARRMRHFIWRNNLGGLDFITCTGLLEQKFGSKYDIYQKTIPQNDYTAQQPDLGISNIVPSNAYKINTGMKTRGEISSLLSMFYSKQQFLFDPDANEIDAAFWFIPIFSKLDGTYRKDKDYTQALPFEFQLGFNANTHYTID